MNVSLFSEDFDVHNYYLLMLKVFFFFQVFCELISVRKEHKENFFIQGALFLAKIVFAKLVVH